MTSTEPAIVGETVGADAPVEIAEPHSRFARLVQHLHAQNIAGILARGAAASFLVSATGMVISFAGQILLARGIHAEQYGEYTYVLAIMNIAVLVGKLEFDACSVRFVGAYHGTGNWSMLRGYLRRSHQIVLGSSLAVSVVGGLFVWARWQTLSPSLGRTAVVSLFLQPLTALLGLQLGCLQGFRRVVRAQGPSVILRPLLFVALIVGVNRLLGVRFGATGAVMLQVIASGSALALSIVFLAKEKSKSLTLVTPTYETRLWMRTSLGLMLIAGANAVLGTQTDLFVIGTLLPKQEAGIYGAASQLSSLIGFGVTAIIFIAVPMIADMHARNERIALQHLVQVSTRWALAVSAPATALLLALGPWILRWYGPEFAHGYSALTVLSLGALITLPIGVLSGFLLTMTGRERQAGIIVCVTALLNLALTLVLTPTIGITGTALATAAAAIIRAGIFAVYIQRHLGLSVAPFALRRASSN